MSYRYRYGSKSVAWSKSEHAMFESNISTNSDCSSSTTVTSWCSCASVMVIVAGSSARADGAKKANRKNATVRVRLAREQNRRTGHLNRTLHVTLPTQPSTGPAAGLLSLWKSFTLCSVFFPNEPSTTIARDREEFLYPSSASRC